MVLLRKSMVLLRMVLLGPNFGEFRRHVHGRIVGTRTQSEPSAEISHRNVTKTLGGHWKVGERMLLRHRSASAHRADSARTQTRHAAP